MAQISVNSQSGAIVTANLGGRVVAFGIDGGQGEDGIVRSEDGKYSLPLVVLGPPPGKVNITVGGVALALDANGQYQNPTSGAKVDSAYSTPAQLRALASLDAAGDFADFDGGPRGTLVLNGNRAQGEQTGFQFCDGDALALALA